MRFSTSTERPALPTVEDFPVLLPCEMIDSLKLGPLDDEIEDVYARDKLSAFVKCLSGVHTLSIVGHSHFPLLYSIPKSAPVHHLLVADYDAGVGIEGLAAIWHWLRHVRRPTDKMCVTLEGPMSPSESKDAGELAYVEAPAIAALKTLCCLTDNRTITLLE